MTDHEEEPQSLPPLKDIGEEPTDEQKARETTSPAEGYPAGTTDPQDGLTGQEGTDNARVTPDLADDARTGQTETPGT